MPEKEKEPEHKIHNIAADITIAVVTLLVALAFLGIYLQAVLDLYQQLLDWIYSRNWDKLNFILAIIFSIINAALIGFIIFVLRRYEKLKEVAPTKEARAEIALPKDEIRNNWESIRMLANSTSPSDWNMAVLRADALLDDMLQHLGYEGTTLAERLKIVDPSKLSSLERAWSAHRLRNMIAHDPLEQHTKETIIQALRSYEQAFRELGFMEESSEK